MCHIRRASQHRGGACTVVGTRGCMPRGALPGTNSRIVAQQVQTVNGGCHFLRAFGWLLLLPGGLSLPKRPGRANCTSTEGVCMPRLLRTAPRYITMDLNLPRPISAHICGAKFRPSQIPPPPPGLTLVSATFTAVSGGCHCFFWFLSLSPSAHAAASRPSGYIPPVCCLTHGCRGGLHRIALPERPSACPLTHNPQQASDAQMCTPEAPVQDQCFQVTSPPSPTVPSGVHEMEPFTCSLTTIVWRCMTAHAPFHCTQETSTTSQQRREAWGNSTPDG